MAKCASICGLRGPRIFLASRKPAGVDIAQFDKNVPALPARELFWNVPYAPQSYSKMRWFWILQGSVQWSQSRCVACACGFDRRCSAVALYVYQTLRDF